MKRWLKFPHGYNGRFGIVKEQGLQFKITITPIYLVSLCGLVAGRLAVTLLTLCKELSQKNK